MNTGMDAYNGLFLVGFAVVIILVIGVLWFGYQKIKDED